MINQTPNLFRRLASMLYDILLVTGLEVVLFLLPNMVFAYKLGHTLPGIILLIHFLGIFSGYFLWFWHRDSATLPMRTWRLRLVSQDGTQPKWSQLILRLVLAGPCILTLGLGIFWAVVDRDRQFLQDRLAGTRIVMSQ